MSSRRPTSSADSRVGTDLRERLRNQALKHSAGQRAHQDHAHLLFLGLADHAGILVPVAQVRSLSRSQALKNGCPSLLIRGPHPARLGDGRHDLDRHGASAAERNP